MTRPVGRIQVDALFDQNGNPVVLPIIVPSSSQIIVVQDQQVSGTNGANQAGGWNVRPLNTTVVNTLTGASLGVDQVTLPAGTYIANATISMGSDAAQPLRGSQVAFYNATTAAYICRGVNARMLAGYTLCLSISGGFTLLASSLIELRHYAENGIAAGCGLSVGGGVGIECFATASFTRIS
jgi:hypothetical protein